MADRQYGGRSIRWRLGGVRFGPFPGGLNLRDAFTEVPPTDLVDGTNFTLDELGVAIKRNDCPSTASFPSTPPGTVTGFYYSVTLGLGLLTIDAGTGTKLYKCAIGGGSWVLVGAGVFTVQLGPVYFVDYVHQVIISVGGALYTFDGTIASLLDASPATAIAVWENKLWRAAPTAANPARLYFSDLGTTNFNTAVNFVDVREKDEKPITALFPAAGGLLAFKEDSNYRINDPEKGGFQTIDWTTGCVGPGAVCGSDAGIFFWGLDGLYRTNGLGAAVLVGDKLRPRFLNPTTINATTKPLIAGVYLNGRVYFAFPRTSATIPDAIIEYNPRTGWLMEAYFGARVGPFAHYLNATGVPSVSFASAAAALKDLYTGTTRTGFACSLTSGYFEPFGGLLGRIPVARPELIVPAAASLQFGINYLDEGGVVHNFLASLAGPTAGGPFLARLQPKMLGAAFAITLNDTASPLNSLSVQGCELSGLLMALR